MAQLSPREYLKRILLIVGVVNFVSGIVLLACGFMVKDKLDGIEADAKNYVEASQYWAGIPIILIGLSVTIVAVRMPKQLTLNIVTKVFLLISLILCLAVIVAEAGDRSLLYIFEVQFCELSEKYKRDPFANYEYDLFTALKRCIWYNSARKWYGGLVFSAVVILGSSLMGLLSLFANVVSLLDKTHKGNVNSIPMGNA